MYFLTRDTESFVFQNTCTCHIRTRHGNFVLNSNVVGVHGSATSSVNHKQNNTIKISLPYFKRNEMSLANIYEMDFVDLIRSPITKPLSETRAVLYNRLSHNVRRRTFGHVRLAKIQISLRICAFWPDSSLSAFLIAKNALFLHVDNEDSVRLRGCTGWFESLLDIHVRRYIISRYGSDFVFWTMRLKIQ